MTKGQTYRQRHPERARASVRRYAASHPRDLREWMREYNARPEVKERHRLWNQVNKKRIRLRRYGLTVDQYDTLVGIQNGGCAVCGRVPDYELVPDHDHQTGAIRGLLCQGCNAGIGYLGDTIEALERALAYLKLAPNAL